MRRQLILVSVSWLVLLCPAVPASTFQVAICGPNARDTGNFYTGDTGDGLRSSSAPGLTATAGCPLGEGLFLNLPRGSVRRGATASFKVSAPQGITITGIHVVDANSFQVGDNHGWWGEFYWNGGPGPAGRSGPIDNNFPYGGCCSQTSLNSQSIGWFMACQWSSCSNDAFVHVGELQLTATEARAPAILATGADNLWYQTGWLRGSWPADIRASDPSGVCSAFVSFGSLPAPFSGTPGFPNRHTWKQCPDQRVSALVNTSTSLGSQGLGVGAMQLSLAATNAANVAANPSKTVYVDNEAPTVTLSGPTDVSSAAGTQYITASAAAGPSGVSGISCSLDGAPYQWHDGPAAQLPVRGVGLHAATCTASNNAHAHDGTLGQSVPASWTLRIRQPTVLGISFSNIVGGLHCAHVRKRIKVPGRWVTIKRHHRLVPERRHAHTRLLTVFRCHPQTARRRVTVWTVVRRHGRLVKIKRVKTVRVLLPTHVVTRTTQRVRFGQATRVSGWLGTSDGTALGGQPVRIVAAPDNGLGQFSQVAAATTRADGSWAVVLTPGPSRLVEAAYDGATASEPVNSAPIHLTVPALVRIQVDPRIVPWGSRIVITGRVLGGYIPPKSNVLRLLFGDGPKPHTIGTPDVRPDGQFSIPISWSSGRGVVRYWFAVATLAEADYPYASGISRRVEVTVGLPTSTRRRRAHWR